MSNPKQKAKELVDKYYYLFSVELENTICNYEAKYCALIAVEQILENGFHFTDESEYWQEVKTEIEKI